MSQSGKASWHIKRHGQRTGPVTDLELACLAHAHGLQATDLIWCNGMRDWVPAGSIAGLLPRPLPGKLPPLMPPRPHTGLGELYQHYRATAQRPLATFDAQVPPSMPTRQPPQAPAAQPVYDDMPDIDSLSTSLADALRAVDAGAANAFLRDGGSLDAQEAPAAPPPIPALAS